MSKPDVSISERYGEAEIAAYYDAGFWRRESLFENLADQARARPDKTLIFDSTTAYTYAELHEQGLRLAVGLRRLGIEPGDRVAVQVPNWAEFGLLTVALNRAGAIVVPIMPIYRGEEVGYVLTHSEATTVITADEFKGFHYLEMFEQLKSDVPGLERVVVVRAVGDVGDAVRLEDLQAEGDLTALIEELGPDADPDDGFLIIYTSGTTARPKGCFHTVNTLRATAYAMAASLDFGEDDVQFGPSPVSHATGVMTSFLMPLVFGASSHLMEAWEPVEGMRRIQQHGCTVSVTATAFLQMMMGAYEPGAHDLSSVRIWVCAGAPIPGSVVENARTMLSGGRVLSLYGRSENFLTTMCTTEDPLERSMTSDGSALHGASVQVVDTFGAEVPRGEEGDIAYKGPSHMLQYFRNPEETAALFTASGHSRSGDLGRMDADGFVRVTGRLKDIVIRGGMNISARELEDLLGDHPAVASVAVVGYPDDVLGERVCAFVVPASGSTAPTLVELNDFLRQRRLATQKLPERLEIATALPMTATGKVQKHLLRAEVAKRVVTSTAI